MLDAADAVDVALNVALEIILILRELLNAELYEATASISKSAVTVAAPAKVTVAAAVILSTPSSCEYPINSGTSAALYDASAKLFGLAASSATASESKAALASEAPAKPTVIAAIEEKPKPATGVIVATAAELKAASAIALPVPVKTAVAFILKLEG